MTTKQQKEPFSQIDFDNPVYMSDLSASTENKDFNIFDRLVSISDYLEYLDFVKFQKMKALSKTKKRKAILPNKNNINK